MDLLLQKETVLHMATTSLQACIASALKAGEPQTATTAAELVLSYLGSTDRQQAAEALLLAQSCQAVLQMEACYDQTASPQVAC